MDEFELVETLDDVQLAKSSANGLSELALSMSLTDGDAWRIVYGSALDAAVLLAAAEEKLKKLIKEG